MSNVKNITDVSEFDQEVSYHLDESNYHYQEYLKSQKEAKLHFEKYMQHLDTHTRLVRSSHPEQIYA